MGLKRSRGHLIVGSILLLFGGIAFALFDLETLGVGLAAPGLVLFIAGLYKATKTEKELRLDERMQRINDRFRTIDIVTILAFIGIYSFFTIRFYYDKKGFK